MLSHSMEISASLTKLFCWLGKSVQPLPSRHPKDFAMLFQKTQGKEGKPKKATFVTQRFLGHNCWLPRCAHVRVPRYMPRQPLGILTQVPCQGQRACLLAQPVLSTGWTKQLYWLGKLCIFANLTYDICVAMLEMKCQTALPRLVEQSFLGHLCLKHTDVSALNVSHILAQRGNFSRLRETLYCVATSQVLEQISTPYIEKHLCGTKILGTQLFETTQMCQGSTCHVVAQHGDISKLNKALLLTWEVCATIAIKTSKKISQCCSKKHKANEGKPRKATFVTQRFLGHNCWLPRCAHVRVPRYMPRQPLGILTQVPCQGQRACLLAQHVLSTGWTKQLYWLGKLCVFANLTYDICVAMLEMKCQTALPRLVEQSFLGHLCLKHTDVSALNVSHILAQRGNFSRLREKLYCIGTSCAGIPP